MVHLDRIASYINYANSRKTILLSKESKPDKQIESLCDSYERGENLTEEICGCYPNYSMIKGMPKTMFGDRFGYDMQDDIFDFMTAFYEGKITEDDIAEYFEQCCVSMRSYRTEQCQTSGKNSEDNKQIISQVYELFAKQNMRAASNANYLEGKEINSSYGGSDHDWVYYNADYYYQCEDIRSRLRLCVETMTDKWGTLPIDIQEVEKNSKHNLDGRFDFNSGWNFTFRNQCGMGSLANEASVPPQGFKMFFKNNVNTEVNSPMKGMLKIHTETDKYELEMPFWRWYVGIEGLIFNVEKLLRELFPESKRDREMADFFNNISIFDRGYADKTGLINIFGNYEIRNIL